MLKKESIKEMWVITLENVTLTPLSELEEKELKKAQRKTELKKLNDLRTWFSFLKNELLKIELDESEKIETFKITQVLKEEFENYIDDVLNSKPRYCEIYKKRIGLISVEKNTLEGIANQYGISGERVRQIVVKSSRRVVRGRSHFTINFLEKIKKIIEQTDKKCLYQIFVIDFIDLYNSIFAKSIIVCLFGLESFNEFVKKNNNYNLTLQEEIKDKNKAKKIIEKQEKFENAIFFPGEKKKYNASITSKPSIREIKEDHGGKIFLTKAKKEIQYQSNLELEVLKFLESHPRVCEINTQCMKIRYFYLEQARMYYPNIVIKTVEDYVCVIDVMMFYAMPQQQNLCKFKALHKFCEKNGMGYAIIDGRINSIFDYHKRPYDSKKAKILIDACAEKIQLNNYEYLNLLKEHNITITKTELATIAFCEDLNLTFYPFKLTLGESLRKREAPFNFYQKCDPPETK